MKNEIFNLENFPTSESAKRMLSYVTAGFYDKSYVGKWLYQIIGQENDITREIVESLPYQFFPETATWGLMYHEMKWKLPVRTDLPYEERRKLIYQKRDLRAPMIPYRIEEYLKNVTDFDVRVFDIHDRGERSFSHPNMFWVRLIGEGTPNVQEIKQALNRIKQSHTIYTIFDYIEQKTNIKISYNTKLTVKNNILLNPSYLIQLGITTNIKPEIFIFPILKIKTNREVPIKTETKIICRKEVQAGSKIESKLNISKEYKILPKYKINLIIGNHPNRYNGVCKYDGKSRYYVKSEKIL